VGRRTHQIIETAWLVVRDDSSQGLHRVLSIAADHEFAWHQALSKSFVETEAALAAYAAGEFLYAPTGGGPALPSEFYGEAIIPEAYVRRNWTASLNLVAFVDDRSVVPQALIVMQKPE
jgi:hypothetical protein